MDLTSWQWFAYQPTVTHVIIDSLLLKGLIDCGRLPLNNELIDSHNTTLSHEKCRGYVIYSTT